MVFRQAINIFTGTYVCACVRARNHTALVWRALPSLLIVPLTNHCEIARLLAPPSPPKGDPNDVKELIGFAELKDAKLYKACVAEFLSTLLFIVSSLRLLPSRPVAGASRSIHLLTNTQPSSPSRQQKYLNVANLVYAYGSPIGDFIKGDNLAVSAW